MPFLCDGAGDEVPSEILLALSPRDVPVQLGAGLCARDRVPIIELEPLRKSLAKLAAESSLLSDGFRALGSSLLLLCL